MIIHVDKYPPLSKKNGSNFKASFLFCSKILSFQMKSYKERTPIYTAHKNQTFLAELGLEHPHQIPSQNQGSVEPSLEIPELSDLLWPGQALALRVSLLDHEEGSMA